MSPCFSELFHLSLTPEIMTQTVIVGKKYAIFRDIYRILVDTMHLAYAGWV